MARPSKNPNHPLVRLRKTLSLSRTQLAERTRIAESTLHDIELGKFKMSPEVAIKISLKYWVHPQSLLKGDDPLLGGDGREFSANSPQLSWIGVIPQFREARQQLFEAIWDSASEKKIELQLAFSFETWLLSAIEELGLETVMPQKLTKRLHSFDPIQIRPDLRPKNGQLAAQWKMFEAQIEQEHQKVFDEDNIHLELPDDTTPCQRALFDSVFKHVCRAEARDNLREAQREKEKAAREAALKAMRPMTDRERALLDMQGIALANKLEARREKNRQRMKS